MRDACFFASFVTQSLQNGHGSVTRIIQIQASCLRVTGRYRLDYGNGIAL